jgi:hypothetical protein
MSAKELSVSLTIGEETEKGHIRVEYSPFNREAIDGLLEKGASYLFIAFFNQSGENKIALGDGLRHEAFRRAVEEDRGGTHNWVHGQMWFNKCNRANSLHLRYHSLGDSNKEGNLASLLSPINSDIFCQAGVMVNCGGRDYRYSPALKVAKSLPV